jgi:hypothetical protein
MWGKRYWDHDLLSGRKEEAAQTDGRLGFHGAEEAKSSPIIDLLRR